MSVPVTVQAVPSCPQVTDIRVLKNVPEGWNLTWTPLITGQVFIVKLVKVFLLYHLQQTAHLI